MRPKYSTMLGLLFCAGAANAEIVGYRYADTDGELVLETQSEFINSTGNLTVYTSAGLDRLVELRITDGNSYDYVDTSEFVTIDDRIDDFDDSFYGKLFTVPSLSDGSYTIRQTITDRSGGVVKQVELPLVVDTVRPVLGDFIHWYVPGSNWQSEHPEFVYQGQQFLSSRFSGAIDIEFETVGSPIDKVIFTTEYLDDGWHKIGDFEASITSGVARLREARNDDVLWGLDGAMPYFDTKVRLTVSAEDLAGNMSSKERVYDFVSSCWISKDYKLSSESFEIIGIEDTSFTGDLGIPGTTGYRPFKPGEPILFNPAKFAFRLKQEHSKKYNELNGLGRYNRTQLNYITTHDGYAYHVTGNQVIKSNGATTFRMSSNGDYCGGYFNVGTNFAEQAAPPNLDNYRLQLDGGEWIPRSDLNSINKALQAQLPGDGYEESLFGSLFPYKRITGIQYNASPKPYTQYGTTTLDNFEYYCEIPPNQTMCEAELDYDLEEEFVKLNATSGVRLWKERDYNAGWHIGIYLDHEPPLYVEHDLDLISGTMSVKIDSPKDTESWGRVRMATAFIEASKDGDVVLVPRSRDPEVIVDLYTYDFDLEELDEGEWSLNILAYDSAGNELRSFLEVVEIDKTAPTLTFYNQGELLVDGETVRGLESIEIVASEPIIVVGALLSGGPTDDRVQLSVIPNGDNSFLLDYPRIFPSMREGEDYQLTMEVHDYSGNVAVGIVTFDYVPNNLIVVSTMSLLPIAKIITNNEDKPIFKVETNELRDHNGQLITDELRVIITLRDDAAFPIIAEGHLIYPGESHDFIHDMKGNGGRMQLPISAGESSKEARAAFMVEIPNVDFN